MQILVSCSARTLAVFLRLLKKRLRTILIRLLDLSSMIWIVFIFSCSIFFSFFFFNSFRQLVFHYHLFTFPAFTTFSYSVLFYFGLYVYFSLPLLFFYFYFLYFFYLFKRQHWNQLNQVMKCSINWCIVSRNSIVQTLRQSHFGACGALLAVAIRCSRSNSSKQKKKLENAFVFSFLSCPILVHTFHC